MPDKLVLFDLGNVVIPLSIEKTLDYWSRISNIPPHNILSRLSFGDQSYVQFELGDMPSSRFRQHVSRQIGFDFSERDFDIGWNAMIGDVYPGIGDILQKLKENCLLAVLSNTNEIHEKYYMSRFFSTLRYFDRLFLSHKIHVRKPEQGAFQQVLDYYHLSPKDVLFFDDRPENTDVASRMGMTALMVSSGDDIIRGLGYWGFSI